VKRSVDDLFFYLGKVAERLCDIGAAAGTSGNISVKVNDFPPECFPEEGSRRKTHHRLERDFPELYENRFLITGSGKNLRYIRERPHENLALVELKKTGCNILWGLEEGERITSEYPAHFVTYQHRLELTAIIHAHPTSVNVIARLFRDESSLNRLLYMQHEQLKNCCPDGIGLIDRVEHGSFELAASVASCLTNRDICAVVRHGTFSVSTLEPIEAINMACDFQEYYDQAARTFLDNPWVRLLPMDFMIKNLGRVTRLPLGGKLVDAFLRPPK
jgi:rhamnulose-1-phosphate aldolase